MGLYLRATGTRENTEPGAHCPVMRGNLQVVPEKSIQHQQPGSECLFFEKGAEVILL